MSRRSEVLKDLANALIVMQAAHPLGGAGAADFVIDNEDLDDPRLRRN